MNETILVFAAVAIVWLLIRNGVIRWPFRRSTGSVVTPTDDTPLMSAAWEHRLLAESLDEHRRKKAKGVLFAELREISEAQVASSIPTAPAATPTATAQPLNPFGESVI